MRSRRQFLKAASALPLLLRAEEIAAGLEIRKGAVNTAIFERRGRKLLIDPGELDIAADWALFTHHHRDQAATAHRLQAKLAVPAKEAYLFAKADRFWDSIDLRLYHRYEFRPHMFTLREPAPVARELKDGDLFEWEGLRFEVIGTPGHTDGSLSYLVETGGKRIAFTGDLICGPGKIWEVYSLQKRFPGMKSAYTGFGGGIPEVEASLARVLERKPDLLVPSHGVVITDPPGAVEELKRNLDALLNNFLITAGWRTALPGVWPADKPPMLAPLPAAPYPKWFRDVTYTTKAIVAGDGSVFLSDCGSQAVIDKLAKMQGSGEIGRIEGLWITHYHDDHTEYVNRARRRFEAKVHVQRGLLDIIENPTAYNMPCLIPEAIRADRIMEHGEAIEWKGFRLTAYYFPGQTLYHAGLLVEREGYKLFLTGDSFNNWGINPSTSENRCFLGRDAAGYQRCLSLLLEVNPDLMVSSHYGAVPVSREYLRKTAAILDERERLFARLFPHEDPNFGTDPYWIRAYPYRQKALPGGVVEVEARVMNHAHRAMRARAELTLPAGWMALDRGGEVTVPARIEGRIALRARAPESSSRRLQVIGLRAEIDGRSRGEFAEAIIDLLG